MKTKTKTRILSVVEGAVMVALAIVLDMLPLPEWPQGGGISVAAVPLIYYAYRRGIGMGLMAGLAWSCVQMITGFYVPPANTFGAIVLCVLLDYVLAFSAVGVSPLFARLFGERRLVGYAVGAVGVGLVRCLCSVLSGGLLWGSYAPEGVGVWAYSIGYNCGYMIPNAVISAILIVALASAADPLTLRPYRPKK